MNENDLSINSFLSDEEFSKWKNRLENILLVNQLRFYKNRDEIICYQKKESTVLGSLSMDEYIPEEIWKPYYSNKSYKISSIGRAKFEDKIVPQIDEQGKIGYLMLDGEKIGKQLLKGYVYTMVAMTFLEKPDTGEYHIHHITNNGYDNSIGNLVYLSKEQHRIIHEIENKYRNYWNAK
jgi:hypothetical protein